MTRSDDEPLAQTPLHPTPLPSGLPALAFAPEAHLPRERRLLIDGSGVVLETALGIRHTIAWTDCAAVLSWPDRIEILLNSEVSVLVREADWHRGRKALQAIVARAPSSIVISMPDNPEPEPEGYRLRGLAATSAPVLAALALATAGMAGLGLGVGSSDSSWAPIAVAMLFLAVTGWVLLAIRRRLQVPARWRDGAAVRGRASVRLDSRLARRHRR